MKQHRSFDEYVARLREISVQIPDVGKGEELDRFVRGLKPRVSKELILRGLLIWKKQIA